MFQSEVKLKKNVLLQRYTCIYNKSLNELILKAFYEHVRTNQDIHTFFVVRKSKVAKNKYKFAIALTKGKVG